MYTTIEADIKDGRIFSKEARKIPADAHVLITFLSENKVAQSDLESAGSLRGVFKQYGDALLVAEEPEAWEQMVERKHEAD
jgi:hypothetical protein